MLTVTDITTGITYGPVPPTVTDRDDIREAYELGALILHAQRREDASPIDGSDHPITCRRRCCR